LAGYDFEAERPKPEQRQVYSRVTELDSILHGLSLGEEIVERFKKHKVIIVPTSIFYT
jgi:hypothetical protein